MARHGRSVACGSGAVCCVGVAILLESLREAPHPCAYLADQEASLDVRVMVDVSPAELGGLLARGWRRFGPVYFRPACAACSACSPTRVVVAGYQPSRNQRRVLREATRLVRAVDVPHIDDERLALYARWHADRERQRGWEPSGLVAEQYEAEFAFPHPSVREVTFRDPDDDNRLVGVGIVDEVPDALSAVYFFWDPDHAPASLGTAHVLRLIEDAAPRGLSYVYLGYKVEACPSLAYKGRFRPQEALVGWPALNEAPTWVAGPDAPAGARTAAPDTSANVPHVAHARVILQEEHEQ